MLILWLIWLIWMSYDGCGPVVMWPYGHGVLWLCGLARKRKEEYKHAVLKSRGYPVDPTTSKAIDEQVDAPLEKGLVEERLFCPPNLPLVSFDVKLRVFVGHH